MGSSNFIYNKAKRRSKRFLTLVEVALSFSLISIILFILFSNFKSATRIQNQMESARPIVLEKQMFYQKLNQMLSLADPNSVQSIHQEDDPHPSLTLTFDNGLDPVSIFSDQVRALLSLNDESDLILEIYSMVDKSASKREILLKGVEEIAWDLKTTDIVFLTVKQKAQEANQFAFFLPKTLTEGYSLRKKETA